MPIMTEESYGRIVNMSSVNGQVAAMGQANYSASKGGLIAFTRTANPRAGQFRHYGQRRSARAILKPHDRARPGGGVDKNQG
jgi:NAD(P)-dependent dehydrogenase (short-subunit alcohol dehydrogenase family)